MAFGRKPRDRFLMMYEYGCLPPVEAGDDLLGVLRLRHVLWNKLVEIGRPFMLRERALLPPLPYQEQIADLGRGIKEKRAAIKAARKQARRGTVDVSELRAEIARMQEQRRALLDARKEERARRETAEDTDAKAAQKALQTEWREANRTVLLASGLHWMNREDVALAYDRALNAWRQNGWRTPDPSDPHNWSKTRAPRFRSWDGTGRVFVRWQNGLPVPQVFGDDKRLRIDPVPSTAWDHPIRAERRRAAQTTVRIRIRSEDGQPVWVTLPMVMHRPLPADGEIRFAAVSRDRIDDRYRHHLLLSVAQHRMPIPKVGPAAGIDLGWRLVTLTKQPEAEVLCGFAPVDTISPERPLSGLRVAVWKDETGHAGQIILPQALLDEHHKLDDIHSIRDKRFNDARDALQQWLTQAAFAPEWLRNATAKLAHWRSIRRLLTLIDQWRTQRFPGDESVLETLLAWAERENHLRPWEVHGKDQIIGRRRELYRRFAARIAAKYGTIFVENFDLRQVARKPTAEKGTRGSTPPDWQRTVAAVSTLRSILHSAARRAGAAWASVPAVYSTMECHNCGSVEHFDAAAYITHACKKCGTVWDQDVNAAQIILERGLKVRPLPGEAMHPQTP